MAKKNMFQLNEVVSTDKNDVGRIINYTKDRVKIFNGVNSYWIDKEKISSFSEGK